MDTPSKPETKIIYFRESYLQSLYADLTTYAFLVGSVWFNQKYCGGSYFLNGIILVMLLSLWVGRAKRKMCTFTSKQELIDHLQGKKAPEMHCIDEE